MRLKRRRCWPFVALAVAGVSMFGVPQLVDYWTRDPPNYSLIEDRLWLGGFVSRPPPGCQAVLNLCETEDRYQTASQQWSPILDAAPAPNLEWLRQQIGFIEAERAAGRAVFVHCANGVSRSALVVTAYLMKREGWPRERALEFLRTKRPGVRPHPEFMNLLDEWERSLTGQVQHFPN